MSLLQSSNHITYFLACAANLPGGKCLVGLNSLVCNDSLETNYVRIYVRRGHKQHPQKIWFKSAEQFSSYASGQTNRHTHHNTLHPSWRQSKHYCTIYKHILQYKKIKHNRNSTGALLMLVDRVFLPVRCV